MLVLAGGKGARLGHLLPSGDTQRISRAIGHLRTHLDEPLKIDDIARQLVVKKPEAATAVHRRELIALSV